MKNISIAVLLVAGAAAFASTGGTKPVPFKQFAYEGCMAEGKYGRSVCACNADNLDKNLSEEEKNTYRRAALGDLNAGLELLKITDKLLNAILQCAK